MTKFSNKWFIFLFTFIFTTNFMFSMNSDPSSKMRYDSSSKRWVIPRHASTSEVKLEILELIKFIEGESYYDDIQSEVRRICEKMYQDDLRRDKFETVYNELKSLIEVCEFNQIMEL